jgi:hypothetical protein
MSFSSGQKMLGAYFLILSAVFKISLLNIECKRMQFYIRNPRLSQNHLTTFILSLSIVCTLVLATPSYSLFFSTSFHL